MNAIEIEQAISELVNETFDPEEFPYAFLAAFGNKATTIKRLRSGTSNKSDLGGVLQTKNIHIAVAQPGAVTQTLAALRVSPATTRYKAQFILATDGEILEAEALESGELIACAYADFPDHFGTFLPLAGISIVRQIQENTFDIRATSRLNKLYVELLKDNPDWGSAERRPDMNHFMARLIFCFFAEDTDIFRSSGLFTATIDQMSERDASNAHAVISEIFRAMNTPIDQRNQANLPRWADVFPYVNGGLFSDDIAVPHFSRMARSYLIHIGHLDWTKINPDIFGSMIQAVADDEERGALGMHYTSRPNILKVLNPLFLDDLHTKLEAAGDSKLKLLNLRKRLARIRVFDPACGSGNFLVIAYKQLREIEHLINERRGEKGRKSDIPLTNFRGIELRDFPAEIARLALIIAEYQCNVLYLGQREALAAFLPLNKNNWITCGNALRLDWLSICPPTGTDATPVDQAQVDFENEGGETYICGNPPYLGNARQNKEQKAELKTLFEGRIKKWRSLDYVAGWFIKAADYCRHTPATAAFVSTNSICQGQQVPILWPLLFEQGCEIEFAHTSFKWANLAAHNAGVTVAIIGISNAPRTPRRLFTLDDTGETMERQCEYINAYLACSSNVIVTRLNRPIDNRCTIERGNDVLDGGNLLLSAAEVHNLQLTKQQKEKFVRKIYGATEFIRGAIRYCLWVKEKDKSEAYSIEPIRKRIDAVHHLRAKNKNPMISDTAKENAHRFIANRHNPGNLTIVIPKVSSENRDWLPVGIIEKQATITDLLFFIKDTKFFTLSILASKLHKAWIATVCGKLETRYRYSNTLGWNTFPVPTLTEKNKTDLTRCAEDILLAREHYFPATIADMYDPKRMDQEFPRVRAAHERNDEVLERIYIGRRFKNDTERLEKLFELYTKMTEKTAKEKKA